MSNGEDYTGCTSDQVIKQYKEYRKFFDTFYKKDNYKALKKIGEGYITLYFEVQQELDKTSGNMEIYKFAFKSALNRLYLGLATEFIIRAAYLKEGYLINRYPLNRGEKYKPLKIGDCNPDDVDKSHLIEFHTLIDNLEGINTRLGQYPCHSINSNLKQPLHIARIWRAKEAHFPTAPHTEYGFSRHYILKALIIIYDFIFNEDFEERYKL